MKRLIRVFCVTIAILLVPAAAYAVNVSSDWGSGDQHVNDPNAHGFGTTGTLKSTRGGPVYFSGLVVYDDSYDNDCGRYTSNTTSTSGVTRGGTCTAYSRFTWMNADAAKFRICNDQSLYPDPCGSWSSTDRF